MTDNDSIGNYGGSSNDNAGSPTKRVDKKSQEQNNLRYNEGSTLTSGGDQTYFADTKIQIPQIDNVRIILFYYFCYFFFLCKFYIRLIVLLKQIILDILHSFSSCTF